MMRQTPFGHDRTAARHNARHTVGRHGNEGQAHARMNREIVHALLGLFDQRVAEDLPRQVLGLAIHFFQRLVNRHRANRHG
ncbi:hypothetical protein D3C73_1173890 [compost metagenome]